MNNIKKSYSVIIDDQVLRSKNYQRVRILDGIYIETMNRSNYSHAISPKCKCYTFPTYTNYIPL